MYNRHASVSSSDTYHLHQRA
uniref:Uncharacterized protein n=1 Tax=Rhizophora mucronata TaxID=61149 RepID=A0A2P2R1M7_RHIMU